MDSKKYILHVASVDSHSKATHEVKANGLEFSLEVRYGDFSLALQKSVDNLKEARIELRHHCLPFLTIFLGKEICGQRAPREDA